MRRLEAGQRLLDEGLSGLTPVEEGREIFWQGTFVEAMAREGVFPQVPFPVVHLAEQLLLNCSQLWEEEKAVIRGSVARNLIRPSIIGPQIPPLFQEFIDFIDPLVLENNPVWKSALETGAEGQDLDTRFTFREGKGFGDIRTCFDEVLGQPEERDDEFIWEKDGLRVQAKESILPIGIRNWRATIAEIGKNGRTTPLILDMGEIPSGAAFNKDTRFGFGGTRHDMMVVAFVKPDTTQERLLVTVDNDAAKAFALGDYPMATIRGNPIVLLRMLINQELWDGSLNWRGLLWTMSYLREIPEERKTQGLHFFLKWLFLEPLKFVEDGQWLGLWELVPLGEVLSGRKSVFRLLGHLCFSDQSLRQRLSTSFSGEPSGEPLAYARDRELFTQNYRSALVKGQLKFEDSGPMRLLKVLKRLGVVQESAGLEEILRLLTPLDLTDKEW